MSAIGGLVAMLVCVLAAWPPIAGADQPSFIGDVDTAGPLIIDPTVDNDPRTFSNQGGTWAYLIQRMPATKTIAGLTLGDFGRDSCTASTPTVSAFAYELTGHDFSTQPTQIAISTSPASLPSTPGRLSWTLNSLTAGGGPITLKAGHTYAFSISVSGCSTYKQTTWAPKDPTLETPSTTCISGLPFGPAGGVPFARRQWHDALTSYSTNCVSLFSSQWSHYPDGWLLSVGGGPWYIAQGQNFNSPPTQPCASSTYASWGAYQLPAPTSVDSNPMTDYICLWSQFSEPGFKSRYGWSTALPLRTELNGAIRLPYVKLDSVDFDTELRAYAPQITYDSAEPFKAMSVDALSAVEHGDGTSFADAITLNRADHSAPSGSCSMYLAVADSRFSAYCPIFDTSWLQDDPYPVINWGVREDDFIDEPDGDYDGDSLHAYLNGSADRVYGRVVMDENATKFLTYWIYYYYNDGHFIGNAGNHEGDWEYVQIRFGSNGSPVMATYAEHNYASKCPWTGILVANGTHPKVFPGLGTHASYFRSKLEIRHDFILTDTNDGLGGSVDPVVEIISNHTPDWTLWPGKWGASESSPKGPMFGHGQSVDPQDFEDGAEENCFDDGEGATARAESERTSPVIKAAIKRGAVTVRYRIRSSHPKRFVVSVLDRRADAPAITRMIRKPRSRGVIRVVIPRGYRVAKVAASSMDRKGRRSRTTIVSVGRS